MSFRRLVLFQCLGLVWCLFVGGVVEGVVVWVVGVGTWASWGCGWVCECVGVGLLVSRINDRMDGLVMVCVED